MGKPWFRTKKYGYGAGLPCSWEGWVATAAFLAALIGLSALPEGWPTIALVIGVTITFVIVARWKSDQPWSWRWGK